MRAHRPGLAAREGSMTAKRLTTRVVEKPWGRRELLPCFDAVPVDGSPVGEIWFEDPARTDRPLLIKYLFTSERLSIQVHPGDRAARAAGHLRGKDEAWVVLDADDDAVIGIGLKQPVSRDALRDAALDGRIVDLVDWRSSRAGDVYYSPAGTVHALGQGLTIVEVQQNVDLTYRLYDYGRPRELHLDDGIAAAEPTPYVAPHTQREATRGRTILAEGPAFVLERLTGPLSGPLNADKELPVWLIPVAGEGHIGDDRLAPGSVWIVEGPANFALAAGSDLLVTYPTATWKPDLLP